MVFLCLFGTIISSTFPPTIGWRGIVPVRSTRTDVEKLLGSPLKLGGSVYETETERISVFYSAGALCRGGLPGDWNVPRDTVLSLTVSPTTTLLLSDLHLNVSYKKALDPHIQGNIYYVNEEEGARVTTRALQDGAEEVYSILYTPAATDSHLRCPKSATNPGDVNAPPPEQFDYYFDVPFSEEKIHLDGFAMQMLHKTESIGYIIIYAGRRAHAGEAQERGERAKRYVLETHGINAERIVFIDGGHRKDLQVTLYVLSRDAPIPRVVPTLAPSEVQIINRNNDKQQ